MGASYIFTIGARYKNSNTDVLHADRRMPCFEFRDWSHFSQVRFTRADIACGRYSSRHMHVECAHTCVCVCVCVYVCVIRGTCPRPQAAD